MLMCADGDSSVEIIWQASYELFSTKFWIKAILNMVVIVLFTVEEISGIGVLIFWVEISPIQMGWQGLFQYETMTLSKCWWDAPNSAGFCND